MTKIITHLTKDTSFSASSFYTLILNLYTLKLEARNFNNYAN